jgi:hypothetical protein
MKNKPALIMFLAFSGALILIVFLASCREVKPKVKEKPFVYNESKQEYLENELVGIKPSDTFTLIK